MSDSPALFTTDWDAAEPDDVDVLAGPERVSIFVGDEFLTWVEPETWEKVKDERGSTEGAKQFMVDLARDTLENPEEATRRIDD